MKAMTKIVLVGASVISMGALTACQSTANVQAKDHPRMMKDHHKQRHLSPEQREKFEKMRTERAELNKKIQQACDGKAVGTVVQVKAGDKTIEGTCNIFFKADRKDVKNARGEFRGMKGEHRPMRGDLRPNQDFAQRGFRSSRGEPLTDAQRAELVKQYDQRLAQRQAQQKAIQTACQAKKDGASTQFKLGEQTVNGTCHVRFQPKVLTQPATNNAS